MGAYDPRPYAISICLWFVIIFAVRELATALS